MAFSEQEARALVIEAGHKLLEKRLIARTWGNISARVSGTQFVITPSGRAYDTLKAEELVKVSIADLSYEGTVKPSSEKGVHAAAYALRPEVDFIIHTHQLYASAVGAEGEDMPFAPCAGYGLPGTEKLRANVAKAIADNPGKNSFFMEKHGALCLGKNSEEAFAAADALEERCRAAFCERVGDIAEEELAAVYAKDHAKIRAYIDDFAQIVGPAAKIADGKVLTPPSDDEEAVTMIVNKNCAAAMYAKNAKPLGLVDAALQRVIYLKKYSKQKDN